jgi:hypothetical protein
MLKYQLEGTLRKSQAGHIFETYNALFLGGVKISKRSPTPLIIQKYIFQIILRDSKLKLRLVPSEPKTCMHYGNNPTS